MKNQFNQRQGQGQGAAEKALTAWGIPFVPQDDGSILVPGDLDISARDLQTLPDLTRVIVGGDFACHENRLTSLKGAPRKVCGGFYCGINKLTSLEGAPEEVPGAFLCQGNLLTSLEQGPKKVGGQYNCSNNRLASLQGAPTALNGNLTAHNNKLKSLVGAPEKVAGEIFCIDNPLTTLEGFPPSFGNLVTDLGEFASPDQIPQDLRISPETIAREKAAYEYAILSATVLQTPTQVSPPLKFRNKGPG